MSNQSISSLFRPGPLWNSWCAGDECVLSTLGYTSIWKENHFIMEEPADFEYVCIVWLKTINIFKNFVCYPLAEIGNLYNQFGKQYIFYQTFKYFFNKTLKSNLVSKQKYQPRHSDSV